MSKSAIPEGWWWPANSLKAHYMRGFRSLCGRWGTLGSGKNFEPETKSSPDDCRECRRKLEKELSR